MHLTDASVHFVPTVTVTVMRAAYAPLTPATSVDDLRRWAKAMKVKNLKTISFILGLMLCATTSCTNLKKNSYTPVSNVSGYLICNERRLDFVDGYIWMDCEPLESGKYNVQCRLFHGPFTIDQKNLIHKGCEVYLNHQSIPAVLPTNSASISPYVTVNFGRWETATLPNLNSMAIWFGIIVREGKYSSHRSIYIDKTTFDNLRFKYEPLRVEFSTKGRQGEGKDLVEWNISFSSTCYDTTCLMYGKWRGY